MLVLSRKKNERVVIADDIVVTVVDIRGDKVRLGFEAPRDVSIHRQEVADAIAKERENAQSGDVRDGGGDGGPVRAEGA